MPMKLVSATLSQGLNNLRHECVWVPLVFVWVDSEEECDNPRCSKDAEVKQAHLINGEIVTIQVCFTCAQQLALDTGMVSHERQFAVASLPDS